MRNYSEHKKPFTQLEVGQGIVEYALVLILVGIVIYIAVKLLGPAVTKFISDLLSSV